MDQRQLATDVITHLDDIPTAPSVGSYLALAEAQAIVDATIEYVRDRSDAVEVAYLTTHRKRLAVSLSLIPMAETQGASCIDIGCYGYMAHWCRVHLGYSTVVGVELDPTSGESVQLRRISVGDETTEFPVHNFDLAAEHWPIGETFDTVTFFETLEHVATDHMGVMLRVKECLKPNGRLVMSVPNAVSYKTLQEFMSGNPPWVYWFFHPDLSHEPRHQFEYTPFFLKFLVRAAGMRELAFRTIFSFVEEESVSQVIAIGADMGIPKALFGETQFIQAAKDPEAAIFRYPDILYDASAYYQSIHPLMRDRLSAALTGYHKRQTAEAERARQKIAESQQDVLKLRKALEDANQTSAESQQDVLKLLKALEDANQTIAEARVALEAAHSSTSWRMTAPLRRAASSNPRLRRIVGQVYRLYRRIN
jgi:2-polyprenyl-3-methyl-5-hydroxy-6-metoxy-1,4-benzoquinol methylase